MKYCWKWLRWSFTYLASALEYTLAPAHYKSSQNKIEECFTHQQVPSELVVDDCCKQVHQKQVACWRKAVRTIKIHLFLREISAYVMYQMHNFQRITSLVFDFQNAVVWIHSTTVCISLWYVTDKTHQNPINYPLWKLSYKTPHSNWDKNQKGSISWLDCPIERNHSVAGVQTRPRWRAAQQLRTRGNLPNTVKRMKKME